MNKEFNLIKTTKTIKKLNKKLFLLKYFEQKIWQIHKLSTFLFCFLILLNGLSASLSAIEKSKLANELKKKISTINLSSISDEEELTQELLSLFDYDSSEDIQFSKDLEEEGEENNENNAQVLLQLLDVIDEEGIEIEKEFNKTKNEKEENKILKNNEGKEGEGKEFNLINSTIINSNNLFNLTTKKEEKEEIKNILNSTNLINKEIKIEETTINLTKNNDGN
ncbi:unnamed protein product [Meloidogyne enterolobii]|uniref:Uncharacterized protein n=1 Tax=Meloidogyne enterolobii TaxID=390850 RepID=A0ACB0YYQ6_MELEN